MKEQVKNSVITSMLLPAEHDNYLAGRMSRQRKSATECTLVFRHPLNGKVYGYDYPVEEDENGKLIVQDTGLGLEDLVDIYPMQPVTRWIPAVEKPTEPAEKPCEEACADECVPEACEEGCAEVCAEKGAEG